MEVHQSNPWLASGEDRYSVRGSCVRSRWRDDAVHQLCGYGRRGTSIRTVVPYRPDWPRFRERAGHSVDLKPGLGILFDSDQLERIRRNVEDPTYRPLMDVLRVKAGAHLLAQPESFGMKSGTTINRHHRAHEIAMGELDPSNVTVVCGFVGLVDRDEDLLRMTGQAILVMAQA